MTTFTKEQEQYIEQEVKIRLHDEKFQIIERDLDDMKSSLRHIDNKLVLRSLNTQPISLCKFSELPSSTRAVIPA